MGNGQENNKDRATVVDLPRLFVTTAAVTVHGRHNAGLLVNYMNDECG